MVWKCDKCGKTFKEKQKAQEHEKNCGKISEYRRKCKLCGKVWHSLVSREGDIKKNITGNKCLQYLTGSAWVCSSCGSMCGSPLWLLGLSHSDRNVQAQETELDRLKKCPKCGSNNYIEEILYYEKK
jgi:rubredoxin